MMMMMVMMMMMMMVMVMMMMMLMVMVMGLVLVLVLIGDGDGDGGCDDYGGDIDDWWLMIYDLWLMIDDACVVHKASTIKCHQNHKIVAKLQRRKGAIGGGAAQTLGLFTMLHTSRIICLTPTTILLINSFIHYFEKYFLCMLYDVVSKLFEEPRATISQAAETKAPVPCRSWEECCRLGGDVLSRISVLIEEPTV